MSAELWAEDFGLAVAPLFEAPEGQIAGQHHVLLDGGHGTFAMSSTDDELWRTNDAAAWAWSSDIAHHVTVTSSKVGVVRWDRPGEPKVYSRKSVERSLPRFYSFLVEDRLRSNKTVVDHVLGLFRRLRSLSHVANIPDERVTDVFTAVLASLVARDEAVGDPARFGLRGDAFELCARLSPTGLEAAVGEVRRATGTLSQLVLHPALTVRHAAGQLFQEAHFELLRAPDNADLFGIIGAPEVSSRTRGGAHYTPPALARSVVEQTLSAVPGLPLRERLVVADPACGSGAFLYEVLRALRRSGFEGHLTLYGQDISPAAIAMAEFVLRASLRDWGPRGGVELRLRSGDSLGDLGMPEADVLVMNPPFIAFGSQTEAQREQMRDVLGPADAARGDYSMAFIVKAIDAVLPSGAMGVLFPASLLSLKAGAGWRDRLASAGRIRLLASIGDFGLFAHALVQVACAVLSKEEDSEAAETTALVTENDPKATSEALRWLRKVGSRPLSQPIQESGWTLFPVRTATLRGRSTWRLPSPESEQLLEALRAAQLPKVADLFVISQGIQTGLNEALLLTSDEWQRLPARERIYFRLATMTDSIRNGRVEKAYRVFYPHNDGSSLFESEDALRQAVPIFYRTYLEPNRLRLSNRATIVQTGRADWWGLMRHRSRSIPYGSRILSKFFGGEGAFAPDPEGEFVPVMGHVWFPRPALTETMKEGLPPSDIVYAYAATLNSEPFVRLLSLYSPHVAGGQFDLSVRHVGPIPIPNYPELSTDPARGRLLSDLVALGRKIDVGDPLWRARTSSLVAGLYGAKTFARA